MPSASRPGAHFRVDFDDATFAEDLEHTSSDTGRELAHRERDKLTAAGLPPDQRRSSSFTARSYRPRRTAQTRLVPAGRASHTALDLGALAVIVAHPLADGCGPFAVPFGTRCGPFAVSRPTNSREHERTPSPRCLAFSRIFARVRCCSRFSKPIGANG